MVVARFDELLDLKFAKAVVHDKRYGGFATSDFLGNGPQGLKGKVG